MMNILGAIVLIALLVWGIRRATGVKKQAQENKQKAAEFWTENGKKDDVQQTRTGLQYQVLEAGSGASPAATDVVKVHYHGTLLDGSVFDSSVERGQPISFGLNQVIPGWTEGLQLMKEGGKSRLFIPSELAYGDRAVGSIPPGSLLIFDVELIAIQ